MTAQVLNDRSAKWKTFGPVLRPNHLNQTRARHPTLASEGGAGPGAADLGARVTNHARCLYVRVA